jgi:SPOR domain
MAAHIGQPTRSRRFIKVYLTLWALAAVGALGYLATLAFPPSAAPPRQQIAEAEPSQAVRAMAKTMKDMQSVQGSVAEIRKDVTQLQDAMGERVVQDKAVQSRLTALEERVATIETPQAPSVPAPKAKAPAEKVSRKLPDTITTAHILNAPRPETAQPPTPKADARSAPIETGSIASTEEITFGEAVVVPAGKTTFAVQLAAGPSLQGLKQSWGQLVERHGGPLAALQPRVVAPRTEGGPYRLLAGPIPTKADADRICTELGVGRSGCFATPYTGVPL